MSQLLKERWNRLAFGKGNQSLNESFEDEPMHESGIPMALWELSDSEEAMELFGVYEALMQHLRRYTVDQLNIKIDQLREEIEEEYEYLDDLQNQYDSAIYPKEQLIAHLEDVIEEKSK